MSSNSTDNNQSKRHSDTVDSKKSARPWDILRPQTSDFDFEEDPMPKSNLNKNAKVVNEAHVLFEVKAANFIKNHQNILKKVFLISSFILAIVAWFIPSSYYATLHVFAPEFSDNIGTRLSLFTQRIEYASFPVDSKTPISILSRRLREETAKDWVLNKIKSDPVLSEKMKGLIESSVGVETYYVPNQQILQIDGYANTPELSVQISYLYQQYLMHLIKIIEDEQSAQVRRWFDLTNKSVEDQMASVVEELRSLSSKTMDRPSVNILREAMGNNFTNTEIKKNAIVRTILDLKRLKSISNFKGIAESVDLEVQSKLAIYNQLLNRKDLFGESKIEQARLDIIQTIDSRLKNSEQMLNESNSDIDFAKNQMAFVGSKDSAVRVFSEQENDLRFLLTNLRTQKIDLAKLKSQVEMETGIRSGSFKVMHEPLPNPDTLRPNPVVKYGLVLVIAVLLSFAAAFASQMFFKPYLARLNKSKLNLDFS